MGLDVGVVKISYLERPYEPIYDFLFDVASGQRQSDWGGGWEGNAFVEFLREDLIEEANKYIVERNVSESQAYELRKWLSELPWDGDTIMLHLNW